MSASLVLDRVAGTENAPVRRRLSAGEILFRAGATRTHFYVIEQGTIALYRKRLGLDVVEFIFTDDVIGLGALEKHIDEAQALSKSSVRLLPLDSLDDILRDERAQRRYADTVHREFAARRNELIEAFRGTPVKRVASFFVALSQLNTHEGREPNLIVDSLECGIVANCLGLDIESLGRALVELEKKQLIERTPLGLRVTNLESLEGLSKQ
jgi:CRP/FNR family transcriptional regulator